MWQAQNKGYVDGERGYHVIRCVNQVTGAAHVVQIRLAHDECPHCHTPIAKDNLGQLDPQQVAKDILAELNSSHQDIEAYAKKHGLEIVRRQKA